MRVSTKDLQESRADQVRADKIGNAHDINNTGQQEMDAMGADVD